jgi:hypothetical protein
VDYHRSLTVDLCFCLCCWNCTRIEVFVAHTHTHKRLGYLKIGKLTYTGSVCATESDREKIREKVGMRERERERERERVRERTACTKVSLICTAV